MTLSPVPVTVASAASTKCVSALKLIVGHPHSHRLTTRVVPIFAARRSEPGTPVASRSTTDWGVEWWETTVNLRPSTLARDEASYRNHIEPTFGDYPIGAINHIAVRQWVAGLSASGLAPATVPKAFQILSKVMRSAVDAELIASSPCERVPLPKIERHEMRFLDPEGVTRLANKIDPRYRALVLLGAYGGLRMGEMFGPPKTSAGRRSVPLPRFVVDELAAHVCDMAPDALVFEAPHGGPIRASLFRRRTWRGYGRRLLTPEKLH